VFFSLALTPDMLPSKRLALPPLQPEPVMEMPPAMAVVESPPTAVISSTQFETQEPELAKLDADDNKIELLAPVNFKNDKDVLAPESRGVLDAAAAVLAAHPEIERVRIEGHTDNKGKPKYNKGLSDRRAKAVMRYLIAKGIEAQRLTSEGFGDTRPVMPNATEAGRAKNRRVELVIIGMKLAARANP
jgi:outer membrane protein OmpA-like peptidoglycan-associated protein